MRYTEDAIVKSRFGRAVGLLLAVCLTGAALMLPKLSAATNSPYAYLYVTKGCAPCVQVKQHAKELRALGFTIVEAEGMGRVAAVPTFRVYHQGKQVHEIVGRCSREQMVVGFIGADQMPKGLEWCVQCDSFDKGGESLGCGSAVYVDRMVGKSRVAFTAGHVVRGAVKVSLRFPNGRVFASTRFRAAKGADAAVLVFDGDPGVRPIGIGKVAMGAPVVLDA